MPTFAELYCTKTGCAPHEFSRRVFWRTLHRRAVPLAPLLLLSDYFESDRTLISACARATRMKQICEEIHDQSSDPHYRRWLRQRAKLRISTRRLRALAETCFGSPQLCA
jgi:hypothetical protein